MKYLFLSATICLFAAAWLDGGQPPPTTHDDGNVPSSIVDQAGKVLTGQQFLEKMVGDYECEKLLYTGGGKPKSYKGTCKQSMKYGGKFLFSEFDLGEGASAFTGLGITTYMQDSGLFTSTYVDSRQKMSLRQSREKFNGKEIILFSGTLNNDPKARVSRTVTVLEDDGRKILHRQFNIADGKETVFMELHMKRKN